MRLDGPFNRYVNDRQILEEVARQLGLVGIRARVNALDKLAFFSLIDNGRSDFHLLGWACETGDAGDALDSVLHSPAAGTLGSFNTVGLADRELDALIEEANRSSGMAERTTRLQAALARVAALRPVVPLMVQAETLVLSPRIAWDPPYTMALQPADVRLR